MSWLGPETQQVLWRGFPTAMDAFGPYDPEIISAVADGWMSVVVRTALDGSPTCFGVAFGEPIAILIQSEGGATVDHTFDHSNRPPFIQVTEGSPFLGWASNSHPFYEGKLFRHYILLGDETVVHVVSEMLPVVHGPLKYDDALIWARSIDADFFSTDHAA